MHFCGQLAYLFITCVPFISLELECAFFSLLEKVARYVFMLS